MSFLAKYARQCAQPSAPVRKIHFSSARIFIPQPVLPAVSSNGAGLGNTFNSGASQSLLQPTVTQFVPSAGIKHVGVPHLRCRHCYFVIKDEQKFVMCTAKARHYQAQKMPGKKWGNYILTHATQGSTTKGDGKGSRHMTTQQSFRLDF